MPIVADGPCMTKCEGAATQFVDIVRTASQLAGTTLHVRKYRNIIICGKCTGAIYIIIILRIILAVCSIANMQAGFCPTAILTNLYPLKFILTLPY